MYGIEAPFDQRPLNDVVFPDNRSIWYSRDGTHHEMTDAEVEKTVRVRQAKMDSLMESICNIAVGFLISYAVWMWIVIPLFNLPEDYGQGFLITCIFTVTSLIRQYVLRRMFDGRTIWETIRAKIA